MNFLFMNKSVIFQIRIRQGEFQVNFNCGTNCTPTLFSKIKDDELKNIDCPLINLLVDRK